MLIVRLLAKATQKHFTRHLHQLQFENLLEKYRKMAPKHRENPAIFKLDSDNFKSLFTEELQSLSGLFEQYGFEIRIAGGAVRDLLSGIKPKDLDFATTATPTQMKEMFTKENIRLINANGEKHGTITPRINDKENFEVTTLRIDVATDGRHAEVQFTTDWLLDANRRDLTINSMFLGLDGQVYDYFYGYEDLQNKRVVFVGNAESRIQEDFLRILRYFRFYGRICTEPDNHDEVTIAAIKENVSGLDRISGERIWMELKKIIEGNFAPDLLKKIIECGCGPYIGLPNNCNIEEMLRVGSLIKENNSNQINPMTLLSSLLNCEEEALKLHARLKFSSYERDLMLFLINNRETTNLDNTRPLHLYKMLVLTSPNKHAYDYTVELLKYQNSSYLEEFSQWQLPKFPINGKILKDNEVPVGKLMGLVMNKLKLKWADSNFSMNQDELCKEIPSVLEELQRNKKVKCCALYNF